MSLVNALFTTKAVRRITAPRECRIQEEGSSFDAAKTYDTTATCSTCRRGAAVRRRASAPWSFPGGCVCKFRLPRTTGLRAR
ncbi:hypothetical protein [Streptomyces rimosus]|uniref:hypothetical protein n=1 Tax=Streptomyces rimosus TaxID=1927 RepID=UPI0037D66253